MRSYGNFFANIERGYWETSPLLGNIALPPEMQNIPLAEKRGLVVSTKELSIRNVIAPYNPSLIDNEKGYLIFFRYDVIDQACPSGFNTNIGCAQLDKQFNQIAEFERIETGSVYSEDPRAVKIGDEVYLFFNDLHPLGGHNGRTMRVGKVNFEKSKVDYVTNLDLQIQHIEKNWVPFEYIDEQGPQLYIEYMMNPHKILKLPDPHINSLVHFSFDNHSAAQRLYWPHFWGTPRGGAPARKIDNQYMSFFHSCFRDKQGYFWYLMGAYTFEAKPPFRITAISHYPIMFDGIYNSPLMNTAPHEKRVIFPSGFTTETTADGRELIHVTCGENDCAIKIVTLNKNILLESLKRI